MVGKKFSDDYRIKAKINFLVLLEFEKVTELPAVALGVIDDNVGVDKNGLNFSGGGFWHSCFPFRNGGGG